MNIEFLTLSEFKNQRLLFSRLVYDTYVLIDFIGKDYEHLCQWYWGKAVPWVFTGDMEFFMAIVDKKVVGILIAKKGEAERKICTLYVDPMYAHNGIASRLIESSFNYLGTSKPIIIFSERKLEQFIPILQKYDWKVDDKRFKEFNKQFELKCNTKIEK